MKGEDLKKLLENNPYLLAIDIRYTIAYLLRRRVINPSVLIDELQISLMRKGIGINVILLKQILVIIL